MSEEQIQMKWFAMRTAPMQEVAMRDKLLAADVEAFVPVKEEVKLVQNKRKKVLKALIPRMLFLRTNPSLVFDLVKRDFSQLSFVIDKTSSSPMIVPDKQMNDFKTFIEFFNGSFMLFDQNIKVGDKVRVIGGELKGLEGELIRIRGHKRLVVRLEGLVVLAAEAYIPRQFIERI